MNISISGENHKRGISINMMEALIRAFEVKFEDFESTSTTEAD